MLSVIWTFYDVKKSTPHKMMKEKHYKLLLTIK